jgi:hypothetical protein
MDFIQTNHGYVASHGEAIHRLPGTSCPFLLELPVKIIVHIPGPTIGSLNMDEQDAQDAEKRHPILFIHFRFHP